MASGKRHFQANIITSSVLTIGTLPLLSAPITICSLIGCAIATLYTPDIDDPGKNYFENIVKEITAKILMTLGLNKHNAYEAGRFMQRSYMLLTMPYALFITHRSWVSHFPIIGTIGRFIYIDLFPFIFLLLSGGDTKYTFLGSIINLDFNLFYLTLIPLEGSIFLLFAWAINDLTHTPILDGGMYRFSNKNHYLLGKRYYEWSRKVFA